MSNRVNIAATILILFAARHCLAQSSSTEKAVRGEFLDAVVTNPALHGVWVDLKHLTSPNNHGNEYALEVVLDSQPEIEKSQRDELLRIAKTIPRSFRLEEEPEVLGRLPFRQFLDELKKEVEFSTDLAGAALEDAYYFDDARENVFVVLVGRDLNDRQTEKIMQMGNAKIGKLFGDSVRGIQKALTTTTRYKRTEGRAIVQKQPSPEVASFCFDLGLQQFTGKKYDAAYVSFTRAHLESPARIDIQYWRTVSLLGSQCEGDAKALLQTVVDGRPRNSWEMKREATEVLRSLERVQGPLRWKLTALENSLVMKTHD